jgi:ketosteroid isomerase-like protein
MQQLRDAVGAYQSAFNRGDLDTLMALYEPEASLVLEPGQVAAGASAIRASLGGYLALKSRLEIDLEALTVVAGADLALVSGPWTLSGTGPDGAPLTMSGRSADVLRRQPDGTWRWVIDAPFGTGSA